MASIIDNDTPIDFRSAEYEPLFRRLQGNIVKGHGRNFTANIFLRFQARGQELKGTLRWLAETFVTSAYDQLAQREQHLLRQEERQKCDPGSESTFGNLFLTRLTYEKLGLKCRLNDWFPDPGDGTQTSPVSANFLTGMRDAADDLGDDVKEAVEPLEIAYLHEHIDALLLLANDSESRLLEVAHELMAHLESTRVATTVAFEVGRVLRNERCDAIEHFGYVDGISQPLFLDSDFRKLAKVGAIDRWNPFAPLSLALLRDRGVNDPNAFGSYYVFRKLEQNVRAFHEAEKRLASALRLDEADQARAGAMIIGRFRDGTPLASSGTADFSPARENNFRYDGLTATLRPGRPEEGDRLGLKCPFQAHIRKTNPRQSQNALSNTPEEIERQECEDRRHRIVRRGITYGTRTMPVRGSEAVDDLPEGGVGLLFACFQRSIIRQFAFIQKPWANTSTFKVPGIKEDDKTGLDPVIGQPASNDNPKQRWRKEYGGRLEEEPEDLDQFSMRTSHETPLEIGGFVKFRGGEFFFAPSLPFLLGK